MVESVANEFFLGKIMMIMVIMTKCILDSCVIMCVYPVHVYRAAAAAVLILMPLVVSSIIFTFASIRTIYLVLEGNYRRHHIFLLFHTVISNSIY